MHCAAGKDRTGWAVATLLRAVGVSEEDVLADYLRSNEAVPALRAMLTATMGPGAEPSPDLLGVREEYLRIGTESVRGTAARTDARVAPTRWPGTPARRGRCGPGRRCGTSRR
ncbi:phosphotyrosine protein phosphatase ptpb [Mycobacteroides abscessus subsp. abscessus]|nr:phosphotyrosine protein phosphatase ptpb [Mycobacteroides abscessus subsp. abscessus]